MKTLYCFHCRLEVPMLDPSDPEESWICSLYGPLSEIDVLTRKRPLEGWGSQYAYLISGITQQLMEMIKKRYLKIMGLEEMDHETYEHAIQYHRLDLYGPPCSKCGKPLRSPQATVCVVCR